MRCSILAKILALSLALSSFAFAKGDKSVYFDATVGGAYSSFLTKFGSMDYKGDIVMERVHYYGFGPAIDLKAGINIGVVVPFVDLQLMYSGGTLESYGFKYDESANRIMLGAGANFFPFKNPESAMHGAYVGLSVGIMAVFVDRPKKLVSKLGLEEQGFSASLDLGKLWKLNEEWSVGVSGMATVDGPIRFGEDPPDSYFYTLWLGVTIAKM